MSDTEIIIKHLTNACDSIGKLLKYNFDKNIFDEVSTNLSGDKVKQIDVLCHNIFEEEFKNCELIGGIASEECDNAIIFNENAPYILIVDPCDGSSNVNINITTGSIFSIYKSNGKITQETFLQSSDNIVFAGYSLYGSSTSLIIATETVNQYQIINGELKLYNENIKCPHNSKDATFSINSANYNNWNMWNKLFYEYFIKQYAFRYVGSLVADFHRTLLKGGVFAYPADEKNKNGKLRLLYEVLPMAFIMSRAGGYSPGLDYPNKIVPKTLHQKSEFFTGSIELDDIWNNYLN